MKLTLLSSEPDCHHLACEGEVTQIYVPSQDNPLRELLGDDCFRSKVLLNLEKTTFIDSAGIGWLVMSHKHFKENGGKLVVYAVPPMVDHVFRLLQMPSVLHIADDEASARALLKGGTP